MGIVIGIGIFITIVLFIEAAYLGFKKFNESESRTIRKRLRTLSAGGGDLGEIDIERKRILSEVPWFHRVLLNSTMQTLSTFWSAQVPCEQFADWLGPRLSQLGLRALRTFDLHDARMAAGDCQCPHHGTSACDCQMLVLLVYAASSPPVTMVIHGSEGKTWVSLIDRPGQRADGATMLAIQRALEWDAAIPT